uniref:NADH-ubiquinone oxidoreductase B15 subunit n=1 Tax=Steinernema glaseri TaxID=37863 RepID=A0A1I7Z2U5_9BILA
MNSLVRCCRPPSISTTVVRNRVSYYQPSRRWPPRFVRRFFLRYPNAHLWGTLGVCSVALLFPIFPWFYNYATMSREEFMRYRDQYNIVIRERQKFGTSLYFPFFNDNKAVTGVVSPAEDVKKDV